jgi:hypothetical protein
MWSADCVTICRSKFLSSELKYDNSKCFSGDAGTHHAVCLGVCSTTCSGGGNPHRVFDVLDSGPKTVHEIHEATGASKRGLIAIMNALVGLNFLGKDKQGSYSLTPESAAFLVSTKPGFQGGMIRHCSERSSRTRLSASPKTASCSMRIESTPRLHPAIAHPCDQQ